METATSKKTKFFDLYSKDKKYTIEISLLDYQKIIIRSIIKIGIDYKEYYSEYTLETLKINKVLSLYDTLQETFDALINILETSNKDKPFIVENKKEIILNIPINLGKFTEITFTLKEKEKNLKEITDNLIQNFNLLQQNNTELTNKVNELNEKMKNFENRILELEAWKKNIEEEKQKKINAIIEMFNNSKIVLKDEVKMVKDWINQDKNISFELLYQATRDGDSQQTFHSRCDNRGSTMIFIKIENGRRLGAYTSHSFSQSNNWVDDSNAFLFSLDNKSKYDIKSSDKAFYDYNNYFNLICWFGYDGNIEVFDKFLSHNNNSCYINKEYNTYNTSIFNLTGINQTEKYNFKVLEFEVYKVTIL